MDADLRKRLTDRMAEWRVEAARLHRLGFEFEASTLDACLHEIEEDLGSSKTGQ